MLVPMERKVASVKGDRAEWDSLRGRPRVRINHVIPHPPRQPARLRFFRGPVDRFHSEGRSAGGNGNHVSETNGRRDKSQPTKGESSEMQTIYRFVRSRTSQKIGDLALHLPIRSQRSRALLPSLPAGRRLSPVYHWHCADYTETTNGSGRECERIGTKVRTNRDRSTNEAEPAVLVEKREKPSSRSAKQSGTAGGTALGLASAALRAPQARMCEVRSNRDSCPWPLPFRRFPGACSGASGRLASFYRPSSRFFRRWRRYISPCGSSTW